MKLIVCLLASTIALSSCAQKTPPIEEEEAMTDETDNKGLQTTTFGAGCFWCVEAIFQEVAGVDKVESGYSGGDTKKPSYEEVCGGNTGHAEVCQLTFDPQKISFDELLEIFWQTHDPTTLNRQGGDSGTQYRSVIFYHNDEQKTLAEKYKQALNDEEAFGRSVVTEISPFTVFYKAESNHQNYYLENGMAPYCQAVIAPKMNKFRKAFKDKLK